MKVSELIKILQSHNQDAHVVVRGYEGGVDTVGLTLPVRIALNVNSKGWLGNHEIISDILNDDFTGYDVADAILLRNVL